MVVDHSQHVEIMGVGFQAYKRVRNKILNLEFHFGERINIESLCEKIRVSPTPLREAMRKLAEDGLVRYVPRKGYYVYSPTVNDIREIYELRKMLECYALSFIDGVNVDFRAFEEVKKRIESIQKQSDKKKRQLFVKTEDIHILILRMTDNRRIKDAYQRLSNYIHLFQHIIQQGRIEEYLEEHLSLAKAVLNRDASRARRIVERHASAAADDLCKIIATSDSHQNRQGP